MSNSDEKEVYGEKNPRWTHEKWDTTSAPIRVWGEKPKLFSPIGNKDSVRLLTIGEETIPLFFFYFFSLLSLIVGL